MIPPHLMKHRVKLAEPPAAPATDGYGNPSGELLELEGIRAAFVQIDGKTEVATGEGADTVIADYSVYLNAGDGPTPSTRGELRWIVSKTETRALAVVGVREEQEPGATHHVRVFCREAR